MQIEYESRGGFANLNLSLHIDTQSLEPQQAATIKSLVEQAHFFEATVQDAAPASSPPMRDSLYYRLSIDDGRRHRSIDLTDRSVPSGFRPLMQFLQKMAISAGKPVVSGNR